MTCGIQQGLLGHTNKTKPTDTKRKYPRVGLSAAKVAAASWMHVWENTVTEGAWWTEWRLCTKCPALGSIVLQTVTTTAAAAPSACQPSLCDQQHEPQWPTVCVCSPAQHWECTLQLRVTPSNRKKRKACPEAVYAARSIDRFLGTSFNLPGP